MADPQQPQQVVHEQLCAGELASDEEEEEEEEEEGDIGYERLDVAAAVETLNEAQEEECDNMQEGYVLLSQEEEHVHEPTASTEERGDGDILEEPSQPIAMAEKQADAVKQAMAGFTLPLSSVPSWANEVPESVWKQELLQGLRNHAKPHTPTT